MVFQKILVAVDGSPSSDHAADVAVEIASKFGAELHAVYVIHVPEVPALRAEADSSAKEGEEDAQFALARVVKQAGLADVSIQSRVEYGHVADTIVKMTTGESFDLAILGSRGQSPPRRFLLGSVSDAVVHHAACPVLIVKSPTLAGAPAPSA